MQYVQLNKEEIEMKRTYQQPKASLINYTYDEQVVAQSENYNGRGDPLDQKVCVWWSGAIVGGCRDYYQSEVLCDNPDPSVAAVLGLW